MQVTTIDAELIIEKKTKDYAIETVREYLFSVWDTAELLRAEDSDRLHDAVELVAFEHAFFRVLMTTAKRIGGELTLDYVADGIREGIPIGIRYNGEIISAWCRSEWEQEHGIRAGRKPNEIYVCVESEKVEDRYKVTAFSEAKPCGADFNVTVVGDSKEDMVLAVRDAVQTEAVLRGINPATITFD